MTQVEWELATDCLEALACGKEHPEVPTGIGVMLRDGYTLPEIASLVGRSERYLVQALFLRRWRVLPDGQVVDLVTGENLLGCLLSLRIARPTEDAEANFVARTRHRHMGRPLSFRALTEAPDAEPLAYPDSPRRHTDTSL